MARKEHHVVFNRDLKTWDVKREHASRVSGRYPTKDKAVGVARDFIKKSGTELIVHLINGRIQNPDSHGKDSCPPVDRK